MDIQTREGFSIMVFKISDKYSLVNENMNLTKDDCFRILCQPQHIIHVIYMLLTKCKMPYKSINEVIAFARKLK